MKSSHMRRSGTLLGGASLLALLVAAPAAAQDEGVAEVSQIDNPAIDQVTVYGTKFFTVPLDSSTTTKSSLPLIDTPATVTVIDRELIDVQAATDLQEVLRNASGLNQAGNNFGIGDFLQSRGLPVSFAYDGLYGGANLGPENYAPTRSLTNVERVEVLQGANATVYGQGSAGGIINLIEKKPQFEAGYSIEGRAGSYDNYGVVVDATGPLNDKLAYRLVGAILREDGYRDLSNDRNEIYGSLRAKFSEDNVVTFSAAYIDDEVQVDSIGYPVRIFNAASTTPSGLSAGEVTAANLPNDPAASQQLTPDQIEQLAASLSPEDGLEPFDLNGASLISPLSRPNDGEELRLKLRWELSPLPGLTVTPSTQFRTYSSNYVRQTGAFNYVYWERSGIVNQPPRAPLVVDGVLYPFAARRQEYRRFNVEETSWDNFIDVQYEKTLFGMDSETLLTAYYQDITIDVDRASLYDPDNSRSADNPIPYILDIRNPNFPDGSFEDYDFFVSTNFEKDLKTVGVGVQNVTYIAPWLIARAGVGWNEITQDFDSGPTELNPGQDPVDQTGSGVVFNLGLTVKPVEWAAVFVGYGEGRTSFSFAGTLNGVSDRPDSESTNFEVGLKVQDPDGRFSGGITYFETARTNLRYNNPEFEDNPSDPNFNIDVPEFFFDGEDSTDGWQIDLNATLLEGLFVNGNLTIQDARNRQNPNSSTFNVKQKGVPDVFASAFVAYEPPITIAGGTVRFNLGYEYQDERTVDSSAFGLPDAVLPEQGVWDAGAEYVHESWSASIRVENLGDTLAYDRALFLGGQPT
ncbi:MAG: TonB-dependent receptor plug domain-containing protein, partial [Pseudomonadota bacterium]